LIYLLDTKTVEDLYDRNDGFIELILESHPTEIYFHSLEWPRVSVLNQWKALLRVGDYIDCHLNDSKRKLLNISFATCGKLEYCKDCFFFFFFFFYEEHAKTVITVHILHPISNNELVFGWIRASKSK
jgi:hypothetical protein